MGKFANGPRRATMTAIWPSARRVPKIQPRCFRRRRRRLAGEARRFLRQPFIFALTSCRMTNCARAQARARPDDDDDGVDGGGGDGLDECGRRTTRRRERPEMSARPESCSDLSGDLGRRIRSGQPEQGADTVPAAAAAARGGALVGCGNPRSDPARKIICRNVATRGGGRGGRRRRGVGSSSSPARLKSDM